MPKKDDLKEFVESRYDEDYGVFVRGNNDYLPKKGREVLAREEHFFKSEEKLDPTLDKENPLKSKTPEKGLFNLLKEKVVEEKKPGGKPTRLIAKLTDIADSGEGTDIPILKDLIGPKPEPGDEKGKKERGHKIAAMAAAMDAGVALAQQGTDNRFASLSFQYACKASRANKEGLSPEVVIFFAMLAEMYKTMAENEATLKEYVEEQLQNVQDSAEEKAKQEADSDEILKELLQATQSATNTIKQKMKSKEAQAYLDKRNDKLKKKDYVMGKLKKLHPNFDKASKEEKEVLYQAFIAEFHDKSKRKSEALDKIYGLDQKKLHNFLDAPENREYKNLHENNFEKVKEGTLKGKSKEEQLSSFFEAFRKHVDVIDEAELNGGDASPDATPTNKSPLSDPADPLRSLKPPDPNDPPR